MCSLCVVSYCLLYCFAVRLCSASREKMYATDHNSLIVCALKHQQTHAHASRRRENMRGSTEQIRHLADVDKFILSFHSFPWSCGCCRPIVTILCLFPAKHLFACIAWTDFTFSHAHRRNGHINMGENMKYGQRECRPNNKYVNYFHNKLECSRLGK